MPEEQAYKGNTLKLLTHQLLHSAELIKRRLCGFHLSVCELKDMCNVNFLMCRIK